MMDRIVDLLGTQADDLLNHTCRTIPANQIHVPGASRVEYTFLDAAPE